jgi:hypothetical protein
MPDLFGYDRYEGIMRAAGISEDGLYRYWLRRSWKRGGDGRVVCFVMLNPSTADGAIDDPTIRRCMAFVRAWGASVLSVRNLFAYRCTDPAELRTACDPIGPNGDRHLEIAKTAHLVVAAWGAGGSLRGRDKQALEILSGTDLYCLRVTKHGHPQHPLYVRADAQPMLFRPARAVLS